jgi:hypothetical protein
MSNEITIHKYELEALANVLKGALVDGAKYGEEISAAYEAGYYIGTIKTAINHLEGLAERD